MAPSSLKSAPRHLASAHRSTLNAFVFSRGQIAKCQVMRDPHSRESRGFAFVTMETAEEADAAIAGLNATEIAGKTINVQRARRGRARTPTPGAYHGPPKTEGGFGGKFGGSAYGSESGYRAYEPRGYAPRGGYDDRYGAPPPPRGGYRDDPYARPPPMDYGGRGGGDRYGGGGYGGGRDAYAGGGGDRYGGGGGYRDDPRGPPSGHAAPMRDDRGAYDGGMRGGYRDDRGPPRRDERPRY